MLATGDDELRYAGDRIATAASRVQAIADFLDALRVRGALPHGPIDAARVESLRERYPAIWKMICMASG